MRKESSNGNNAGYRINSQAHTYRRPSDGNDDDRSKW